MEDISIKATAQEIVDILELCEFNDITDSSGYYVIREFEDGTECCVDVSKSTGDGTENPHYTIYVAYEDEDFDWVYTNSLSVDELEKKLDELSK